MRSKPAFRKDAVDVSQFELMPASLDEMVPADDPCRLVFALVDLLDLTHLTQDAKLLGACSYHPATMLKLLMFAGWDNERSSRKVAKRCRTDVRYKWLCRGLTPDHTTIWRFRHRLGEELDQLLAQCVRLGFKAGLGGLARATIDGTKLPAAASQWRKCREEAEEEDKELAAELEAASAKPPKKKREALPSKDPDARTMKTRQGRFVTGYNLQFLTDCDTGLVLATHFTNVASDAGLLEPTLAKCLELHQDLPSELLADAGYDTPANAHALHECGVEAWVSCKEATPFWSLDDSGGLVCPMGHPADRVERFNRGDIPVVRLVVDECPSCPRRAKCLKNEGSKSKSVSFDAKADPARWVAQRLKARSEDGKAELKKRGQTAELSFANLKQRLEFRRLSHWGLESCGIEAGIYALALNLWTLASRLGQDGIRALLSLFHLLCTAFMAPFEASGRHGGHSRALNCRYPQC